LSVPANVLSSPASRTLEIRDRLGRNITVQRMDALDRLRLLKAAGPELSRNDSWLNLAALAVSVKEIDGVPRTVAANERQIESCVAELGDHGLEAVSEALLKLDEATSIFSGAPEGNAVGTPF